ncbi:unnamed protein product [Miscanthus lutarioriparius]|uniref:Helicase protein MOM1 n=1 Tax=Miscanthus lutarioriparius TaxID=422564 RepID=A0A811SEL9_9POAL|nr:unnamed protein product [Miscanthus lutarioriparius]
MANTRSGGGDAQLANGRETRSTAAAAAAASAQTPNLRRSTRENKGKHKSRQLPATPSSHRSAKTPAKDATVIATPKSTSLPNNPKDSTKKPTRVSRNTIVSPSPSKQDSNGTSTPASTKRKTQDDAQAASTPSKKQKRLMHAKSYVVLFNLGQEEPESQVLAPLREDEEKASEVQPEGDGAVLAHEESNAPEQPNQEPSNVSASEVLGGYSSNLPETDVILEGDGLKIGSHQSDVVLESCILTETCSLNKAVESIPMLETGEQATGDSNQNSLLELQNSACSTTAYHEEANKSVEDGDSIGIQGACTSRNIEAIQCDETGYSDNICVGCRSREISDTLKSCGGKGCKRHYHLSCMDPPLDVSLGIWLCIMCIKKRLQFGVYSVSEGIESLWDVKEGAENSKQYFVKYKNLAHVHNQWVSESDIVDSTSQSSDLISKFSKRINKEKTIRWKQEWAEPHRLLKRRLLMPPKEAEVFFNSLGDKFVYCNVEWLVKWKDLGYEHATWELESSSFLCTPEAEELKRSYEDRFKAARKASDPSKVDKVKGGIFQQLQRLPDGCPPGLDDDHLRSLNQLRVFWHNSRGAVFIDDQERVIKTILFVASILPHICRPLIVSTTTSLSLWETKFNRLAASINVVVYNGEKDVRKSIQDLEFYEDGSVMLQVLLSHPDAILEDIEAIERINWEAVIVDDCQNSRVSKCLEQLKRLPTNFRMVLLSSSLKESIAEHINLLSFLNPEENGTLSVSNGVSFDTAGTLAVLKAKLARYVAFERKADSSKLLEYWVPARLSPVQLEMYCYILLSNSPALRSHSKTDSVGALRNILISLRKCCDHPYLVDQSLQSTLTKDLPITDILDIGVRSCGKLLLLDRMLQQIKIQGLRVLILSQSGGGSGNPMGDILDDFVRQRFGYESYERVERGLLLQKKQTAMNMFNDKTKGRFIFLIDSRACGPSIKLSSVDAIIIYGSDWNPMNDLRALQKVSMESESEPVPIFRLYSSCTVEEKALILAKHDHILDSNILNITPSLSHCLLSWGASFLFNRLEELQNPSYSNVSGDELFMDNVALEFLSKLLSKVELSTEPGNAAISQAYLRGSFYSRAIVVAGESEGISSVDGDLPKFCAYWLSLLNGRSPHWQHISEPAQRSRRKVHDVEQQLKNIEEQLKLPTEETDEARIKRRRIGEIMDSSPKDPPGKNKDTTILPENNTPSSSHQISVEDTWQELERNNLHGTQKGLHVQLKPELSKLYKLLQLPENVKSLCEEFLEYILKNHQISQEPKGILHAFNLALCWRAASLSKHKINHTESLTLAVKNLNYECKEELAEFVYAKLKILKRKFARRAGEVSEQNSMASVSNISTCEQDTSVRLRNDELIPSQVTLTDDNFENGSHHEATGDFWTEEMVSGEKELLSDPVTHEGERLSRDELVSKIMDKRIKLVDKVFSLRGRSIQDKHSNEVSFLDMHRQKEVAKLKGACSLVVEHLRSSQNHTAQEDGDGKIKLIIKWFTMLLYAFLEHVKCQRNRLDMQQSASRIKESQLKEETLQAAKCGQLDQNFDQHIPLPDFEFAMEEFRHFREVVGSCHVHAAALAPESLDDNSAMEITFVRSANASEIIEEEELNRPAEVLVQGPAPEVASPSVNGICNYSDGINSQGDASLAVPSLEPSSDDLRSTDHVEENTVGSPVQGDTSEHLGDAAMEVETGNRNTALADSPHFDTPALTAPSRQATLPVSREIEMQSNLVDQCAQQSLVSSQPLQGEPEQADLSSAASAQPLQSERQQSIPLSNNLLERAQLDQSQPNYQTDVAPGSAQSAELFPVTSMMFNHPPIDAEPLKNELHKLRLHMDALNKVHEMKKTQLQTECSQELEKVKRKYDLLIKEHDSTHLQQKKALDDFYEKVQRNQSLAEDFRAKFISPSAAQGAAKAHTPPVRHTPQATPQVMRPPVLDPSASSIALSSACRPPVPRPRVQAPQVDQPSSSLSQLSRPSLLSLQVVQPPNLEQGNLFRATSATLSHMPPPRGSYGVQSELAPRSPAPHLQFRSPRAHSMPSGNQQQLPATRVEAMSSRTQPVLAASSCQSDIHAGHLAASAMSSLHSVLPSTSLPSSLHPSHLAQRVPPTPNPTLQAAAPSGSNTKMPSIPTGMQLPDSGSLSLGLSDDASTAPVKNTASLGLSSDAPKAAPATNTASLGLSSDVPRGTAPATNTASLRLSSDSPRAMVPATSTASLRLSSDSPGATAPATNCPEIDVVCLSDDE